MLGTLCTHCGYGCKTTLGRPSLRYRMMIVLGDNATRVGTNGTVLVSRDATHLLLRTRRASDAAADSAEWAKLTPATWKKLLRVIGKNFADIPPRWWWQDRVYRADADHNEEAYLFSKFARVVRKDRKCRPSSDRVLSLLSRRRYLQSSTTARMADVLHCSRRSAIRNDPTAGSILCWPGRFVIMFGCMGVVW